MLCVFLTFFFLPSCFRQEGKFGSCYSILARSGNLFLYSKLYFLPCQSYIPAFRCDIEFCYRILMVEGFFFFFHLKCLLRILINDSGFVIFDLEPEVADFMPVYWLCIIISESSLILGFTVFRDESWISLSSFLNQRISVRACYMASFLFN